MSITPANSRYSTPFVQNGVHSYVSASPPFPYAVKERPCSITKMGKVPLWEWLTGTGAAIALFFTGIAQWAKSMLRGKEKGIQRDTALPSSPAARPRIPASLAGSLAHEIAGDAQLRNGVLVHEFGHACMYIMNGYSLQSIHTQPVTSYTYDEFGNQKWIRGNAGVIIDKAYLNRLNESRAIDPEFYRKSTLQTVLHKVGGEAAEGLYGTPNTGAAVDRADIHRLLDALLRKPEHAPYLKFNAQDKNRLIADAMETVQRAISEDIPADIRQRMITYLKNNPVVQGRQLSEFCALLPMQVRHVMDTRATAFLERYLHL